MPFTCPKCLRPLTRQNSWHYCKRITFEELLTGKSAELHSLFFTLLHGVIAWPGVQASASKTCAVFIANKTFLVVKVMKAALDLKFVLAEVRDEFPIYKTAACGKKLEHYIRLQDHSDLDQSVWQLLKESYTVCMDEGKPHGLLPN